MAALQDPRGRKPPEALGRIQSLQKLCLKAVGRQLKHFCNLRLHPAVTETLSETEKQLIYSYDLSRMDVFESQKFLQTINKWCCKVEKNSRVKRLTPKRVDRAMNGFLRYVLLPLTENRLDERLHEFAITLGFAAPPEVKLREAVPSSKRRRKWFSEGAGSTEVEDEADKVQSFSRSSEIVLNRLPLASVGCGMIASLLQKSSLLVKLRLNNCQIADAGAILLASGIRLSVALELLDLSNDERVYRQKEAMDNEIGNNGVHALAVALEQNRTVRHVDLSGNPVGSRGGLALATMLGKNESLQRLYLDRTHVQNSAEPLIDAFERSKSLQQLSMLWCALRTGVGPKLASIQAGKTVP